MKSFKPKSIPTDFLFDLDFLDLVLKVNEIQYLSRLSLLIVYPVILSFGGKLVLCFLYFILKSSFRKEEPEQQVNKYILNRI